MRAASHGWWRTRPHMDMFQFYQSNGDHDTDNIFKIPSSRHGDPCSTVSTFFQGRHLVFQFLQALDRLIGILEYLV